MARPTDAPLGDGFFSGGSRLTENIRGLRRFLNELEARTNGILTSDDLLKATPFTDATRPDPTSVDAGTIIFNSDDGDLNVSDGTNWKLNGVST